MSDTDCIEFQQETSVEWFVDAFMKTSNVEVQQWLLNEEEQQVDESESPTPNNMNSCVVIRIFKHKPPDPPMDTHMVMAQEPETGIRKPFAFFARSDGADMLLRNGRNKIFQSLQNLGLSKVWIEEQLANNYVFSMVVVSDKISFPATWDGLLDGFKRLVPSCAEYCDKYRHECKTNNTFFESEEFIEKFTSIERVERGQIERMTPKRFLERTERTFVDFRVLIWTWGSATHLFLGDGYTVDSLTGERGVGECLVPNMTLEELVGKFNARVVPLHVAAL